MSAMLSAVSGSSSTSSTRMDYPPIRESALTNITKLHQKMVNIGSKYGKVGKNLSRLATRPFPSWAILRRQVDFRLGHISGPVFSPQPSFLNFLKQFHMILQHHK